MMATPDPIRLAFGNRLPLDTLFSALDEPVFEITDDERRPHLRAVEYQSVMADLVGTLGVTRYDEINDVGCATFTGPDRLEIAMAAASILLYLPLVVMHASARTSPEPGLRRATLKVLGQVYQGNEGFPAWDRDIEATVLLASRDAVGEVRSRAAATALLADEAFGLRLIGDMLAREEAASVKKTLRAYVKKLTKTPVVGKPIPVDASERSVPRLALPTLIEESLEQTLARFGPAFPRPEDPIRGDDEEGTLEVCISEGRDARMIYWAWRRWGVGCVNLFGPDRVRFALNIGHRVNYFPIELAKLVAQGSRDSYQRMLAVIALGMANSSRFLPIARVDPEIERLIEARTEDPDEEARRAARAAKKMLREEANP
jgi:hypothetical protein